MWLISFVIGPVTKNMQLWIQLKPSLTNAFVFWVNRQLHVVLESTYENSSWNLSSFCPRPFIDIRRDYEDLIAANCRKYRSSINNLLCKNSSPPLKCRAYLQANNPPIITFQGLLLEMILKCKIWLLTSQTSLIFAVIHFKYGSSWFCLTFEP